jgi:hypothetical protein
LQSLAAFAPSGGHIFLPQHPLTWRSTLYGGGPDSVAGLPKHARQTPEIQVVPASMMWETLDLREENQYAKTYRPNWGKWASIKNVMLELFFAPVLEAISDPKH